MTSSPLAPLPTDSGPLDARRGSLLHGSYELVAGDVVVGRLENSAWGHSTMTTATRAWQLGQARLADLDRPIIDTTSGAVVGSTGNSGWTGRLSLGHDTYDFT